MKNENTTNTINVYNILKENFISKKLKIFPIVENAKTPLIESWQNDCSSSILQITYWLEQAPNCNWGLPCTPNNLFVIDIDVHNVDGLTSARNLLNSIGVTELDTLCQKTPSGGLHIIFQSDDDLKNVANSSNSFKDYPGIDIRTDGYIAVYPSKINGKLYTFANDKPVKQMPKELKDFILSQKHLIKKEKSEREEYVKPEIVEEGGRDTALFEYINNIYYHNNLSKEEVMTLAMDFNAKVCDPPLPERVVRYKVNKVFKKDKGRCLILWLNRDEYYEEMEDE